MSTHSIYSPSAAHRWMRCPGAPHMERDYPDTSSRYADEGTAAHDVAARILCGEDPLSIVGERIPVQTGTIEVTSEMIDHVMHYVDVVRASGSNPFVETKVQLPFANGAAFGTVDAIAIDGNLLHVVDLKYGRGELVEAEGNEQLMLYAAGVLATFEEALPHITHVRLVIVQPRAGGVRAHMVTRADIEAFVERARIAADLVAEAYAVDPGQYLQPGEKQCRWCKAKADCPALRAAVEAATIADFDDLSIDTPNTGWSAERLSQAYAMTSLVEMWVEAVRKLARDRLVAGEPVPGFKLVAGRRGARRWADENEAAAQLEAALKEDAYERKLLSPTGAEKALKGTPAWKTITSLVVQPEGAPVIAPESDKRPVWTPSDDFNAVED